jgi:serine-type D-Ala-D-Ala carboxypeptidase/endopeptidase
MKDRGWQKKTGMLLLLTALTGANAPSLALSQTPAVDQMASPTQAQLLSKLDADFAKWMADSHVPGLVWGVVIEGKLVHVKGMGVQDLGETRRLVTPDTGFRIASMSKAFTGYAILKLRDEGKLRLDDPAWKYVPEIKSWGADIRVSDLLHHTAGFVTDDPWGDRQQVMPEAEFTKLLKAGVPRTAPVGTRYEYSNMGFAMLGRIISNVSKKDYASYVGAQVFKPLGMAATTYENADVPATTRAIGYRWENDGWVEEPYMKHGAFGAMGGITTSANDYAKWVGYLLSGWPAAENDATAKTTIRAMQYGGGLPHRRSRPGKTGAGCQISGIYAAGLVSANDCLLGPVLFHGGGFPGYGSHMLLIPDMGVGVFALSNRTYGGPSGPVWDAATALLKEGLIAPRPLPVTANLPFAYDRAITVWNDGNFDKVNSASFAMNFFMDRSKENWSKRLGEWKAQTGACNTESSFTATGLLSGNFLWKCEKADVAGALLLAPSHYLQIQSLTFDVKPKAQ